MRKFAKRLIAYETGVNRSAGTTTPPTFHVCDKLRAHLAALMGQTGFRMLLSCALPRANEEVPWLRAVNLGAEGSLEGLEALDGQISPEELSEGEVVLLAELLGLLVAFIGERLTLRQVREVWPQIPLNDLELGK
jgi:hypothetical protein